MEGKLKMIHFLVANVISIIFISTIAADDFIEYKNANVNKIKKIEIIEVKSHHLFTGQKDPNPFMILENKKEILNFMEEFCIDYKSFPGDRLSGEILKINIYFKNEKVIKFVVFGGYKPTIRDTNRKKPLNDRGFKNAGKFYEWLKKNGLETPLNLYLSERKRHLLFENIKEKEKDAFLCNEPKKMKEFLLMSLQDNSEEIKQYFSGIIENKIINTTECVLDGLLLLKNIDAKKVYQRFLVSPRFVIDGSVEKKIKKVGKKKKYELIIQTLLSPSEL